MPLFSWIFSEPRFAAHRESVYTVPYHMELYVLFYIGSIKMVNIQLAIYLVVVGPGAAGWIPICTPSN